MKTLRAAVVQLSAGYDKPANSQAAGSRVAEAAQRGAALVVLPELWNAWVGRPEDRTAAEPIPGPTATLLSQWASRFRLWIVGGSVLEWEPATGRYYNTCLVLDASGRLVARYRKMHLFDVALEGREVRRESDIFSPGEEVVAVDTPWGPLGLSICYDLRFPELYRLLGLQGATMLAVVSAFSAVTGPAHWQTLLQARAIENQAFVLAADQCGRHPDGRQSHGHSLIVDPWGRVLSTVEHAPGVAVADLNFADLERLRHELPCLEHRRIALQAAERPMAP